PYFYPLSLHDALPILFAQGVDDLERAGAELAVDRDVDLAPAVDPHDVGLDEARVPGRRHVAEIGDVADLGPQRDAPHLAHQVVHRVRVEREVGVAEL